MWLSTKKPLSSSCHDCNYFQYSGTEYKIWNNISPKCEVIHKKVNNTSCHSGCFTSLIKTASFLTYWFSNMLLVTPKNFYISRIEPVESYLKIPDDFKITSYFCISSLLYPRRIVCLLKTVVTLLVHWYNFFSLLIKLFAFKCHLPVLPWYNTVYSFLCQEKWNSLGCNRPLKLKSALVGLLLNSSKSLWIWQWKALPKQGELFKPPDFILGILLKSQAASCFLDKKHKYLQGGGEIELIHFTCFFTI